MEEGYPYNGVGSHNFWFHRMGYPVHILSAESEGQNIGAPNYAGLPLQPAAPAFESGVANFAGWPPRHVEPQTFGNGTTNFAVRPLPMQSGPPPFGYGTHNFVGLPPPAFRNGVENYAGWTSLQTGAPAYSWIRPSLHPGGVPAYAWPPPMQVGVPAFGILVPHYPPLDQSSESRFVNGAANNGGLQIEEPDFDFPDFQFPEDELGEINEEQYILGFHEFHENPNPDVVKQILETVCESIGLDDLGVLEEEEAKSVCSICLEEFDLVACEGKGQGNGSFNVKSSLKRLPCSHLFHSHCISEWFYKNLSCPICRNRPQLPL